MLKLIIEDDEGRKTVVPFVRDEITIGRQEGNTIRLTERNVSRRHARLVRQSGHVLIEDLGSYNGTRINGERIQGPSEIHDGDLVQIGDYDLALQSAEATTPAPARAASRPPEPEDDESSDDAPDDEHDDTPPPAPAPRQHSTAVIRLDQVEMTRSRKVVDLDPEKAPRLVVLSTDFKGTEFACIRTELRLGRTDDNDICIDHRSVSSTHAKLVREDNGEWRIIDMQSANGLTVNGETYAQSALAHGDIIELGHVKLKFIGPGKATGGLDAGGGRSKLPLALGILVVLAGLAAGGYFVLKPHLFPASVEPDGLPVDEPPRAQAPATDEPATPPPAPPARDPEPEVAKAPEAPEIPQLEEKLQGAREAMEARHFDQAVDILESIKDARGKRPAEAETLLDEARAEVLAKKGLAQAHRHLEAGRLDAAAAALDGVVTRAYEEELAEARAKLAAARAPKAPPRPAENTAEANRLLAEASKHIKDKEYQEAAALLEKCVKLAPSNAECHLRLGVSYAGQGNIEKGAKQYRKFYELAPDHPQAPRVKEMLDAYEKQKQAANE